MRVASSSKAAVLTESVLFWCNSQRKQQSTDLQQFQQQCSSTAKCPRSLLRCCNTATFPSLVHDIHGVKQYFEVYNTSIILYSLSPPVYTVHHCSLQHSLQSNMWLTWYVSTTPLLLSTSADESIGYYTVFAYLSGAGLGQTAVAMVGVILRLVYGV